jgi:nucleotide-binding universal stress UspA family protein
MPLFERILVDLDTGAMSHPALNQALELASRCGARVKIVDVVSQPPPGERRHLPRDFDDILVADRAERLAGFAAAASWNGGRIETEILRGRPSIALIQEVLRGRHDLLIRSHVRDAAPQVRLPFGSIDMQLLRKCPCPVWLVGPDAAVRPRAVLAAIDVSPDDAALNRKIVDLALAVADLELGHLTVFHAWTPFGEELLRPRLTHAELSEYIAGVQRTASEGLTTFVRDFGERLARAAIVPVKGVTENALPSFVEAHGIDLVVMGTVARAGVSGWLIGNTAERTLQRLRCSVVAVKPDGFVSPVAPPEDAASSKSAAPS